MDGGTWVRDYAEAIGLEPPSQDEVDAILRVASVAAHASERWAAPISCWLAARAGRTASEALAVAERLADPDGR